MHEIKMQVPRLPTDLTGDDLFVWCRDMFGNAFSNEVMARVFQISLDHQEARTPYDYIVVNIDIQRLDVNERNNSST